jgi:hypothetical protein
MFSILFTNVKRSFIYFSKQELMRLLPAFAVLLAGSMSAQPADSMACGPSCCCMNDPTPSGIMISHVHRKHQWMASYRYMRMDMSGILSGTQSTAKSDVFVNYLAAPDAMHMDMHMLMGMYGISNRLTAMLMLNYNVTSMKMDLFAPGGHHHSGSVSNSDEHEMKSAGLGDIKLHFLYSVIRKVNHQLIIGAGANIPAGSVEVKGAADDAMYPGKRLPYSMQLGSGTFDLLPSLTYTYQKNKITFSAQGSGIYRTQYNNVGYSLGNEATANAWIAYQWLRCVAGSFRMEANTAGKIDGYDPTLYYYNELSANPNNYGGKRLSCYAGTVFQFRMHGTCSQRLAVEYGIPLYEALNGTQMKLKQTFYASWAFIF